MPDPVDSNRTFWEIRYLLTSPCWTARLPRYGALALFLSLPLLVLYCLLLGGPQRLGDFPVAWRISFVLLPSTLAFALFAFPGRWMLKVGCYAVILFAISQATIRRFGESWGVLQDMSGYAWNLDVKMARPPKEEAAMLAGGTVDQAWACFHATEANYLKWATSNDRRAQRLASFLCWRMSPQVQHEVWERLLKDDIPLDQVIELVRIHALPSADQAEYWSRIEGLFEPDFLNPLPEEPSLFRRPRPAPAPLFDSPPCHAPGMFDTVQAAQMANLLNIGVPETAMISGATLLADSDLDKVARASPCYYDFLLRWHPQVRQLPSIAQRLDESGWLTLTDMRDLYELIPQKGFLRNSFRKLAPPGDLMRQGKSFPGMSAP